jgi:LytS/YehU family sensor histidine kinase
VLLTENINSCGVSEFTLNGRKLVFDCEKTTTVSTGPESASSTPKETSSAPPAVKQESNYSFKLREAAHQPPEIREEHQTVHTFGGYIGDMSSAILVAFFAYLIAAKIIVRKTAESEAKVREATSTAEEEALQRQLVQARLKLLQAQVEPHFLFNTLAAVDYLIETDPPRASIMQKQLITYLRGALPQMREDSSTMGREISLVKAYLELLKMRIEDRLEFQIDVPESLHGAVFPPMVLQTIVENAIKHGIEPKPEGGKITIHAQARDGSLWVDVIDTGVGLPEGDVFGKSTNGTGLGLDNIRTRLALLYPGASRIELRSEIPSGTSVRIMVPYQTEAKTSV